MVITENTKISQLIKANPKAIDAIASINSHFNKLRNPWLGKALASRVTIKEAAKIGGSSISEFFKRLSPLGFEIESKGYITNTIETQEKQPQDITDSHKTLDVRGDLQSGKDPFKKIMDAVLKLQNGERLLLINSFEPIPLIKILQKKGYEVVVDQKAENMIYTFIQKKEVDNRENENTEEHLVESGVFTIKMKEVTGIIESIDVRRMEMPLPMVTVLERLELLEEQDALFVHHFKIPYILLSELKTRGYPYFITQEDNDIFLLVLKKLNS